MPTEIDHNAVKTRIVDILKANTTSLFSATPTDKTKLRSIQVGRPLKHDSIPYAYVVFLSEIIKKQGSLRTDVITALEHDVRYHIFFYVDGKDGRKAESNLDSFQKIILETLESDKQLKNGGSKIVDISVPEQIDVVPESESKSVQGRTIILRCTITTN